MIQTTSPLLCRAGLAGVVLVLGLGLSACGGSSDPATSASPSTPATSSSASTSPSATPSVKPTMITSLDAITVSPTTPGKAPTVTAKWPLAINRTQVKVLTPGSGAVVAPDATVNVNYHGINASTGKSFDSSFTNGKSATFNLGGVVAGFKKAIAGQKVGSRVVVMMTSADGYPDGQPSAGINKGDNLVFVIDILASGHAVAPVAGLPVVTNDAKRFPTATMPKTAAPKAAVVQPLYVGPGDVVKASDSVYVSYRSWDWATGKMLEDTFTTPQQTPYKVSGFAIPAMKKAIEGQKVGSRMLLVIPPAELNAAQKKANPTSSAPAITQTLVYVIQIEAAGQAG